MDHKEYKKLVPGADTAILMIHGIIGTPNHFLPFIPLIPGEYSVYNLLLDGHGGNVKDFSCTSMSKWEQQVSVAIKELAISHKQIYITAHSMGTLFAIEQAISCPAVKRLFLLAVPIRIRLRPVLIKNVLKVYLGRVNEHDTLAVATQDSCGISLCKNPFAYLGWIPRYLELFCKISKTKKLLPQLSLPCCAFQSRLDEMVSPKAAGCLSAHSAMEVYELEQSTHFYYPPDELALLKSAFLRFLKQ